MNYCTYRTWITVLLCKPQISTAPSFNSTCLFIITLVLPLQKLLRDVWLQHYLDCLQRWMKIPGKQSVISSTQHLEPQTGKWWLQPMECSQRFQPDLLVLREVFLGIGSGSKSGKQTEEIDKLKWYTKGNFYLPLRRLILKKERGHSCLWNTQYSTVVETVAETCGLVFMGIYWGGGLWYICCILSTWYSASFPWIWVDEFYLEMQCNLEAPQQQH